MPRVVVGGGIHGYRLSRAAVEALAASLDCPHMCLEPVMDAEDEPWGGFHVEGRVVRDGHERGPHGCVRATPCPEIALEVLRVCPALIRVVETLGAAATHPAFGGYVVVLAIPDDVAWFIEVNDEVQAEHVAERHRTWIPEWPAAWGDPPS
jgi:hypothetical protein